MPKVIIWRDGAIETEFEPGHRDWRIGRSETNDLTLLDPRKSVSRFHAELREENGRWVFIDLNSQNGSWKDGLRVNRLELEHGHEVLFGDYKLSFEDIKVAPAPAPVPLAVGDVTAGVMPTRDVPIAPDETLLMPGAKSGALPAVPVAPPAPIVRPAARAMPQRTGVNPLILVLFLIAMLGAVAAVAWRLVSDDGTAAPAVAESAPAAVDVETPAVVEAPAAPAPDPPPPAANDGTAPPAAAAAPIAAPPSATATATAAAPLATGSTAPPAPAASVSAPPASPPVPTRRPPSATSSAASAKAKRLPAQPKESPAVAARYEDGRRALAAGRHAEAQRAFEAVLAQQPDFRDAGALLASARQGQTAAREQSLAEARALEADGEWARAIAAYERAGASEQAADARTKMSAAGDDAYRKARQFDARNRPADAIGWYQRAVQWLPDSDPRKATAQERLTTLKGGAE